MTNEYRTLRHNINMLGRFLGKPLMMRKAKTFLP